MSFAHASVLNLAAVSRDCQVSRKTAEGYLEILEDLLLGFRVEVFSKRAKRAVAAHPKFYFFDFGVFRANRPAGPSIPEPNLTAVRSKASSPNTCGLGAIIPADGTRCTIGRRGRGLKSTSSHTESQGSTQWK